MSDHTPTPEQLIERALRHRELAKRHPEKAARHNAIADALEREAYTTDAENDFAAREQRLERLKVLIAEQEDARASFGSH